MPSNMAMKRPDTRIVRHKANQQPPVPFNARRIPPQRVFQIKSILDIDGRVPVALSQDEELVAVEVERVVSVVEVLNQNGYAGCTSYLVDELCFGVEEGGVGAVGEVWDGLWGE